ncbi:unnamed protein product [Amoebophrya sp. A120]|nr:unnamed protein product [Amoebophrya sp. A120]|eukprot:GSA120T00010055001.1
MAGGHACSFFFSIFFFCFVALARVFLRGSFRRDPVVAFRTRSTVMRRPRSSQNEERQKCAQAALRGAISYHSARPIYSLFLAERDHSTRRMAPRSVFFFLFFHHRF